MELTARETDLLQGLLGVAKSTASLVPVLGQAISGFDAYKQSVFERNLKTALQCLSEKIDDLSKFTANDWLQTEDGKQFVWKVFDSALDAQLADKQELFVNALINGVDDDSLTQLEKLKFVDMLRHMSRSTLLILAEMHLKLIGQVRGPNRNTDPIQSLPQIDASRMAEELSTKFHPYLVNAAVSEMEGQGLFSNVGEWRKNHNGFVQGTGFATELCYTDFTARFVEFITINGKVT